MLEFVTNRFLFFSRKEVWFYNGEKIKPATYTVFSAAQKQPSDLKSSFIEKYFTSIIDLTRNEPDLFDAIHPTFRYDIRAAEKKGVQKTAVLSPTHADCVKLVNDYQVFASEKDLPPLSLPRILAIREKGKLLFTKAIYNGAEVATHIYITDGCTISLTSSFHNSSFTDSKIRSEANKFLHWKDILDFKQAGLKKYDFGGINPQKLPGVSKFKASFGGETTENFRFIRSSFLVRELVSLLKKRKL